MRASDYLQALRRRWFVILLAVDVGLVAGWFLTSEEVPVENDRFAATATLVVEPGAITPGQVVLAMTAGDVLETVSARFGSEPDLLLEQVQFLPDADIGVIEVQMLGPEPLRVAAIPNAFANEVVDFLTERAQADQQERRDELVVRQEQLRQRVAELDGLVVEEVRRVEALRVAGDVAAEVDPLLLAERNSFVNQYSLAIEQFQQLATEGVATARVTVLQEAEAEPISGPEFRRRLEAAQARGEQVTVPAPPEAPSKVVNAAIGGLLGLVLSVALIIGLRRIDPRIRNRDEAAEAFGLPVIGEIPRLNWRRRRRRELVMRTRPRSRYAEAYRSVRTALLLGASAAPAPASPPPPPSGGGNGASHGNGNGNGNGSGHGNGHGADLGIGTASGSVIMVTSPMASDGKTTTAASLAIAFAEEGRQVLLIDADFRRGELRRALGVTPPVVLADVPTDELPMHYDAVVCPSGVEGLALAITAYHDDPDDNPATLIGLQRALIERALSDFDIVVVDTAPVLASNDAADLLSTVDVVLFVARYGTTKKSWARQATESFDRLGAPFAGVVYLGDPTAETAYSYYAGTSRRRRRRPASSNRSGTPTASSEGSTDDPTRVG